MGADGLLYQTLEDLVSCGQELNPIWRGWDSVFSGTYFYAGIDAGYLDRVAEHGRGADRLSAPPAPESKLETIAKG